MSSHTRPRPTTGCSWRRFPAREREQRRMAPRKRTGRSRSKTKRPSLPRGFVKNYPERIEYYLKIRMQNLCPVEFYLRHLLARQSHDTSERLKDIRQPTLILVGEDDRNMTSEVNHRASSDVLAQGIPNSKLVVLPNERHSYFFANPDAAHKIIREFIKG